MENLRRRVLELTEKREQIIKDLKMVDDELIRTTMLVREAVAKEGCEHKSICASNCASCQETEYAN